MPIGSLGRLVQSLESSENSIAENFGVQLDPEGAPYPRQPYPEFDEEPDDTAPVCQWCGEPVLSETIRYCSDDCAYEASGMVFRDEQDVERFHRAFEPPLHGGTPK